MEKKKKSEFSKYPVEDKTLLIIGYILLSVLIFIVVTVMALMLLRTQPGGRRKEPETSKSVCLTLHDSGITPF